MTVVKRHTISRRHLMAFEHALREKRTAIQAELVDLEAVLEERKARRAEVMAEFYYALEILKQRAKEEGLDLKEHLGDILPSELLETGDGESPTSSEHMDDNVEEPTNSANVADASAGRKRAREF